MGHPAWRYRKVGDEVESRIFDSDKVPDGWVDSPAKVDSVKRKPGRPRKVTDGDDG